MLAALLLACKEIITVVVTPPPAHNFEAAYFSVESAVAKRDLTDLAKFFALLEFVI